MLRTKKDVDRHVRDLLTKVKGDTDRLSRGYSISRLYKNVGEFESARRHLAEYISHRPKSPEAHRLLGEIYEALGQKEKAVLSYKTSYEIADSQKDLVLKICDLYSEIDSVNPATVYWVDEGERLFPHHNSVIKLKEKLMFNKSAQSNDDLERLYQQEIRVNPLSLTLHIKLIKLYIEWSKEDKSKLEDAYNYVVKLETRRPFPHSLEWYQNVYNILENFEYWKKPHRDKKFEELQLSILDTYVQQSLSSCCGPALTALCSTSDVCNRIRKLDSRLSAAIDIVGRDSLCGQHFIQQYYFNLATYLLIVDSNESIFNISYLVGMLMFHALTAPKNQKIPSNSSDLDLIKNCWYFVGCHRVSQCGHVLNQLALNNGGQAKFLDKVKEMISNDNIKKTLHEIIFGSSAESSFFLKDKSFGSNINFVSKKLLLQCDQEAASFCSVNLSEIIWLFMHYDSASILESDKDDFSFFNLHMFRGIPFVSAVNTNAPESLSHLDLVAFVVATVFCQQANYTNFKTGLSKPSSVCVHLHSSEQSEWWNAAASLCRNSSNRRLNRLRSVLQNGLESIRHLSHHVLPLALTLHLARYFTSCVSAAKKNQSSNSASEIDALEERAEHYWNKVINQCKKSGKLAIGATAKSRLFELPRSEVTDSEKDELEEEGQLFLADRLESKGRRQEAIQMLSDLKSPEASFKRAMLYKKGAKELIGNFNVTRLSLEIRNEYTFMLTQARDTMYLTLDRLKMPGVSAPSTMDQELSEELASVERSLATAAFDDGDDYGIESPNGFNSDSRFELTNGNASSFAHCASTPFRPINGSTSRVIRQEARPSPERLDAQLRHLTEIQQNSIKNVEDHNTALRTQNESLMRTCQTMADEFKTHASFYKHVLEHKTCPHPPNDNSDVVHELKNLTSAFHGLKVEVRSLTTEISEMRCVFKPIQKAEPPVSVQMPNVVSVPESSVPMNVNSPAIQGVYNNYMGFYGQQQVASPLVAPTALFQPPFLPPSTLADPSYAPTTSAGVKYEVISQPYAAGSPYNMTPSSCAQSTNLRAALEAPRESAPPHSFQIALPSSSAMNSSTTSQLDCENSSATFSTEGLLSNIPAPIHSAVVTSPDKANAKNLLVSSIPATPVAGGRDLSHGSILITPGSAAMNESANSDHYVDDGHDPCPDYQPVIPLPATIEVITGEEEETILFEEKAKLFRFVEKEWRERGLGILKVLHNTSQGTARILMRRDQTLKICCNHLVTSSMELNPMKDQEKVVLWAAQDFADEQLKWEKFCCRFKTVEIVNSFKEAFAKAKKIATEEASPKKATTPLKESKLSSAAKGSSLAPKQSLADMFKPAEGSWACDICLVNNQSEATKCVACGTPSSSAPAEVTSTQSTTTAPSSAFKFGLGSTTTASSSGLSFGTDTTSKSAAFSFGVNTSTPSMLFGTSSASNASSTFGLGSSISIAPAKSPSPSLFGTTDSAIGSKFSLQGFTFSTTPSVTEHPKPVVEDKPQKPEPQKESIFANFSFKGVDSKTDTKALPAFDLSAVSSKPGGLFAGASNSGSTLSFTNLATSSQESDGGSIFKTKDDKAFVAKPLFGGPKVSDSTGDANASKDEVEEYEPEVDFKPVIPMPDLIEVKTGEEDEEKIFCERAKLFRFDGDTKEWKERGVGDIKLLKNVAANRVRILMRRDQTHKVCANHIIISEMKLSPMANSDKAWVWGANDFADEAVRLEKFAIRFKTKEQAVDFQTKFEAATQLKQTEEAPKAVAAPAASKSLSEMFKPASGSWECDACLVMNKPDTTQCAACQTPKPGCEATQPVPATCSAFSSKPYKFSSTSSSSAFSFGVPKSDIAPAPSATFSFGLPPSSTPSTAPEAVSFESQDNGSTFDFKLNSNGDTAAVTPKKESGFTFGSPNKYEFSFSGVKPESAKSPRSRDVSVCESEDGVLDEEEEDNLYFEPVVPLPDKVDVVTGEEDEDVLFTHRAKLFRMAQREFKERGLGDIKILHHAKTGKIRLLMRREQVHKICLNHYLDSVELSKKDDKSFFWAATDYSENEPAVQTFAIRFKTPEIAGSFFDAVTDAQAKLKTPTTTPTLQDLNTGTTTVLGTPTSLFGATSNSSVTPKSRFSFRDKFSSENSSSDSLEVSYEKKATPEQIEKARQLQLPDNFYLFEQAESCPGCRGCDPEDKNEHISTFKSQSSTPQPSSTRDKDAINNVKVDLFGSGLCPKPPTSSVSAATLFGGAAPLPTTGSPMIFGNVGKPVDSTSPGIFGGSSASSLFGAKSLFSTPTSTPSGASPALLFGSSSPSLFGGSKVATPSGSIFGGKIGDASSKSAFGNIDSKNLFGGPKTAAPSGEAKTSEKSILSIPQSAITFGEIASSNSDFSFKNTKNVQSKAWVAKPLFGGSPAVTAKSPNASHNEDDDHDPQFEPVIPMPDLVEVKTGEEGWQNLFSNRAKTYRFCTDTKQWKERGIGDFKIQFEPNLQKYRLLQRREQVHKLSCNHYITSSMELETMASSDVAWCWVATDFSEKPAGELLKLAVRFKTKELATEFKEIFASCQEKLSWSGETEPSTALPTTAALSTEGGSGAVSQSDDDDEEESEEDSDDMEPSEMLTDYCTLYKEINNTEWECLGEGEIRVFYDGEFYLARVVCHSIDDDETKLLDHLIGIETTVFSEDDNKSITWNGFLDNSEEQVNIRYKAEFDTLESARALEETLQEGKDYAFNSGIGDANVAEVPHGELYYGQAQDPE